ncbi:hypothetical protein [Zhongshania aquimaris]|uniref:Uncharacterized protein n=1 Tax=Zhongshania aquimaris TaxID=2857107 RepID=A0ABS6VQS8_9GAMM|nr:hypothetical protein [Zhongshania aquimaris]MBW2940677.1 hypothetical protein [Zhongshania aquimaris]
MKTSLYTAAFSMLAAELICSWLAPFLLRKPFRPPRRNPAFSQRDAVVKNSSLWNGRAHHSMVIVAGAWQLVVAELANS